MAAQAGMFFARAYTMPAAASRIQPIATAARKPAYRRFSGGMGIGLMVTALCAIPLAGALAAQDPPENLAKLVAHRESETEAERNEYIYRQTVALEELDDHGAVRGRYREIRDIIFSPKHERSEQMVGKPENTLKGLILTPEDYADIREIQPLVL